MHPRNEIRNTIQSLLIAASTIAETRVFLHEPMKVPNQKTPCIFVFTPNERVSDENRTDNERDKVRERLVRVHLQLWQTFMASASDPFAALDEFCLAVETVMDANAYLQLPVTGKSTSGMFNSTEILPVDDGEKLLCWALMTYTVSYFG